MAQPACFPFDGAAGFICKVSILANWSSKATFVDILEILSLLHFVSFLPKAWPLFWLLAARF
jgi:hypothetical protein